MLLAMAGAVLWTLLPADSHAADASTGPMGGGRESLVAGGQVVRGGESGGAPVRLQVFPPTAKLRLSSPDSRPGELEVVSEARRVALDEFAKFERAANLRPEQKAGLLRALADGQALYEAVQSMQDEYLEELIRTGPSDEAPPRARWWEDVNRDVEAEAKRLLDPAQFELFKETFLPVVVLGVKAGIVEADR